MKRYFVSVGSQATEGLVRLINNLMAENLFEKYEDVYCAIDSDQGDLRPWGRIRKLAGSCKRVHAIELKIETDDDAVMNLQSSWEQKAISIHGVGGDRTLSEKARNWRTTLRVEVIENLNADDLLILMGSAFGGTSTGLYWGVADYLSDGAQRMGANKKWPPGSVTMIGFAMLPDKFLDPNNCNYPLATNVCDFIREMQVTHWRRRLAGNALQLGITSPIYTREESKKFPLYRFEEDGTGHALSDVSGDHINSYLPMTSLYWVPTPPAQISLAPVLLAEQVFALTYVGISGVPFGAKAVNRWTMNEAGPKLSGSCEDACFGGLRMLVFKSGRARVIRNWFYDSWDQALQRFRTAPESADAKRCVLEAFENLVYGEKKERVRLAETADGLPNTVNLQEYGKRFFETDTPDYSALERLIGCVEQEAAAFKRQDVNTYFKTLSAIKEQAWLADISVAGLKAAFADLHKQTERLGASLQGIRNELLNLAKNARGQLERRQSSWIVKAMDNEQAVSEEIKELFYEKFSSAISRFRLAVRCEKTIRQNVLPTPNRFSERLEDILKRLDLVGKPDSGMDSFADNDYVVQGEDSLKLSLPAGCGLSLRPFTAMLLEAGLIDSSAERSACLADFEQQTLAELSSEIDHFVDAGGADPLEHASVAKTNSLGEHNVFPEVLKARQRDWRYSNLFAIVCGTLPEPFVITHDEIARRLLLDRFANMTPVDANFFNRDEPGDFKTRHMADPLTQGLPIFLQSGLRKDATVKLNGVWLGDVCEDFKLREVLDQVFGHHTLDGWQRQANNNARGEGNQRRLLTLSQMIFFGLVVKAIEEKVSEKWIALRNVDRLDDYAVRVEFSPPRNAQPMRIDWTRSNDIRVKNRVGVLDNKSCLIMEALSAPWTRLISKWVTADESDTSGFYAGYFDGTRRDAWRSIRTADLDILTEGRMAIQQEEIGIIKDLLKAVIDSLKVEIKLVGSHIKNDNNLATAGVNGQRT